MEKIIIDGGKRLEGSISIQGAKNSVLAIMAGSVLTDKIVVINKCPKIIDVDNMIKILVSLGAKCEWKEDALCIDNSTITSYEIPYELMKKLRSSIILLGSLLGRFRKAKVTLPGGCKIGLRPIDIHISGFEKFGIRVKNHDEEILCSCDKINNGVFELKCASVGATENMMLVSVLGEGDAVLKNVAKEPEIVDLQNFLNCLGAKVSGAGTSEIHIKPVKKLGGCEYTPISDRIVAGTYLIAAAITNGEIELFDIKTEHILSLIQKLGESACKISLKNDRIYLKGNSNLKSFGEIVTQPYPHFSTDLQPQATALACVCEGTTFINENMFETRFEYVNELIKMGANISIVDRTAIVKGKTNFCGCDVFAPDLRGGAALVLAGLVAQGKTIVHNVEYIERGYEDIVRDLRKLDANIYKEIN